MRVVAVWRCAGHAGRWVAKLGGGARPSAHHGAAAASGAQPVRKTLLAS